MLLQYIACTLKRSPWRIHDPLVSLSLPSPCSCSPLNPPSAQADDAERLRIHGSNLLGSRLVPTLVENWLRQIGYTQIKRRELGSARTEIGAVRDGEALIVEIDKRGTASGLQAIIDGDADISMSARQPNARELDDAWQLGDLRSSTQEWVVGLDGLVVLVSPESKIAALSVQQLRELVSGGIRDWKQLGGGTGRISVHTLPQDSGTQEAIARLLLAGGKNSVGLVRHRSHAEVAAAVRADSNSIGIVSLRAPRGELRAVAISSGGGASRPIRWPWHRRIIRSNGGSISTPRSW